MRPKGTETPKWEQEDIKESPDSAKRVYWWEGIGWDKMEGEMDIYPAYKKGTQTVSRNVTISKVTARRIEILMESMPIRLRTFSDALRALIEFAIGPMYYLFVIKKGAISLREKFWYDHLKRTSRLHNDHFIVDTFLEEATALYEAMKAGHMTTEELKGQYDALIGSLPEELRKYAEGIADAVITGKTGGKVYPFFSSTLTKRTMRSSEQIMGR
jgi:hypothetical protein